MKEIPPYNMVVLQYILSFLYRVSKHESTNKMGVSNLALVIGPNILRDGSQSNSPIQALALLRDTPLINEITSILIREESKLRDIAQAYYPKESLVKFGRNRSARIEEKPQGPTPTPSFTASKPQTVSQPKMSLGGSRSGSVVNSGWVSGNTNIPLLSQFMNSSQPPSLQTGNIQPPLRSPSPKGTVSQPPSPTPNRERMKGVMNDVGVTTEDFLEILQRLDQLETNLATETKLREEAEARIAQLEKKLLL